MCLIKTMLCFFMLIVIKPIDLGLPVFSFLRLIKLHTCLLNKIYKTIQKLLFCEWFYLRRALAKFYAGVAYFLRNLIVIIMGIFSPLKGTS